MIVARGITHLPGKAGPGSFLASADPWGSVVYRRVIAARRRSWEGAGRRGLFGPLTNPQTG